MTKKDKPGKPKASTKTREEKEKRTWLVPFHFKPGKSGNPSGLAKSSKKPITNMYKLFLRQIAPDELCVEVGLPPGSTFAELTAKLTVIEAVIPGRNRLEALREIREAVEGKAKQVVGVFGMDDDNDSNEQKTPDDVQLVFVDVDNRGNERITATKTIDAEPASAKVS